MEGIAGLLYAELISEPQHIICSEMLAFATGAPLRRGRQRRQRRRGARQAPRVTAEPPTRPKRRVAPPPARLQPSQRLLSTPLTAALHNLFNRTISAEHAFADLPRDTVWHSPLFDLTLPEIPPLFTKFLAFAENPNIQIYDIGHTSFSWTLSFDYPLPWRPRVSVAGLTETDSLQAPTVITDEWYSNPLTLVLQALPSPVDIIWLYPGPHAEVDTGLRKVMKRCPRYQVEAFAPRAELRIRGTTKQFEKELMFATPALPEYAFEGGLRRRERYSAVSPIGLREIDDACEWAVPVPSTFCGSAHALLPRPGGDGVTVEILPKRFMATVRFGGYAMREVVDKKVEDMLQALEEDGVVVGRDNVWVRVYNAKVGFNEKGLLAMAMYGSSFGIPRRNEIAVDISEAVDDNFWER